MKRMKQTITLTLVLAMLLSLFAGISFTAGAASISSGTYVLAANVDGTYYAMPNASFPSKPAGEIITVTNGTVAEADATGYALTVTVLGSGNITISNGTNYLGYGSSTNLASKTDAYEWSITDGTHGTYRIASTATTTRGVVYRTSSYNCFGGYAVSNVNGTEYYDVELLPIGSGSGGDSGDTGGDSGDTGNTGNTYSLTNTLTDGYYVFGAINGTAGTDNNIQAVNDTDSGDWLKYTTTTPADGVITTEDSTIIWKLTTQSSNSFTLQNTSTGQYLVLGTGTGSGSATLSATASTIYYSVVDADSATFELHASSTATASSGNQLCCNQGSGYGYRMYANRTHSGTQISTQIRFYKAASSTTTSYTANFYVDGSLHSTATGTSVYFPAADEIAAYDGYTFQGWCTAESDALIAGTTTAPTVKDGGTTYTIGDDYNLYAVYLSDDGVYTSRPVVEVSNTYSLTNTLTDGYYVFGAINGEAGADNNIQAVNDTYSGNWLKYVTTTPVDGVITTEDSTIIWKLTVQSANSFTLQNTSTGQYLVLGTGTTAGSANLSETASTIYYSVVSADSATFELHASSTATASSGNQLCCNQGSNYGYRMYEQREHGTGDAGISTQFRFYTPGGSAGSGGSGDSGNTPGEIENPETASIKIITGNGTVWFEDATGYKYPLYTDDNASLGDQISSGDDAEDAARGTVARATAPIGEELYLCMLPDGDQRLSCVEKGSDRLDTAKYSYDSARGCYVYHYPLAASTTNGNYFRITFLPRVGDGGYTAVQATELKDGLYVITGLNTTEGQTYTANDHDTGLTYLLYADDHTVVDEDGEAIGRKSSALQLSSVGVSLNATSPYLMTGLNENHLFRITKDTATGYYTMQHVGSGYYLAAATHTSNTGSLRTLAELPDNTTALWDITYLESGGFQIASVYHQDLGTVRHFRFNGTDTNLQFRVYAGSAGSVPVLYSASNDNHKVSYSVEGSGAITVDNITSGYVVASGSYQPKTSDIKFTFNPSSGYELTKVTLNGEDITDQVTNNSYTYTGLNQDIEVIATYSIIGADRALTVNYYANGSLKKTLNYTVAATYVLQPEDAGSVEIGGVTYSFTELNFNYAENGGTIYSDVNAAIAVEDGDTINAYFSTTAVKLEKTAVETTDYNAGTPALGGESNRPNFTDGNGQDSNGNVKQTYEVTLKASSNDKVESYASGGNTDVILVLDHSLSMFPDHSDNYYYTYNAIGHFCDIAFEDANSGNRIAVAMYDSYAWAWNGSEYVSYGGTSVPSDYGLTYSDCFMGTKDAVMDAAYQCYNYAPEEGATNMAGGLIMTYMLSRLRSDLDTNRNLVVVMFTDGQPTATYTVENGKYTTTMSYGETIEETIDGQLWHMQGASASGTEVRDVWHWFQALRNRMDTYANCNSYIYNIALLTASEMTSDEKTITKYLMDTENTKNFRYDETETEYNDVTQYMSSAYWESITPVADSYQEITDTTYAEEDLQAIFDTIAYSIHPEVPVMGTVTDVIPASFKLTADGVTALENAGYTITYNNDGTTTIYKSDVLANEAGSSVTYEIEYQGGGYGATYTNREAKFVYNDLQGSGYNTSYFPVPSATVIPWTVNDYATTQTSVITSVGVLTNDLFTQLTAGGYTLSNFQITLTDANGNPTVYDGALTGTGANAFDAYINNGSYVVSFYTENGGTYTFYYTVSATVTAPDGTVTTVTSRATEVIVTVPEVELDKTAQEVTNAAAYAEDLQTDAYGNVQQLYLVTLNVEKFSEESSYSNGVITDVIPEDFEFVRFVSPTSGPAYDSSSKTITYSGLASAAGSAAGNSLTYLLRYTGNGYGTLPTNASASFQYTFGGSSATNVQNFPVPVAGLNPSTVNDVAIVHLNNSGTLNLLNNDTFRDLADSYEVSALTVTLTDKNGNELTAAAIEAFNLGLVVNAADGVLSFTANSYGTQQLYYVVSATVTLPNGENYAADNSLTLISRPTKITIYVPNEDYMVVDFGLQTENLLLQEGAANVCVDDVNNVMLRELLTFETLSHTDVYGTGTYVDNNSFNFIPGTTNFNATEAYNYTTVLSNSVYSTLTKVNSSLYVIPANNIYYEESFLTFGQQEGENSKDKLGNTASVDFNGKPLASWGNEGAVDTTDLQAAGNKVGDIYGYDEAYAGIESLSNGDSKSVTVTSINPSANAYFTFTGTGFDVYGESSLNSGVMVAYVYRYDEAATDNTYSMGELCKLVVSQTYLADKTYYQLPLICCDGMDYGTYVVCLRAVYDTVFDANYTAANTRAIKSSPSIYSILGVEPGTEIEFQNMEANGSASSATKKAAAAINGQYNLYIDGIRIYNPLTKCPNSTQAVNAYDAVGELDVTFQGLRDNIIDATTWKDTDTTGYIANGALYVAAGSISGVEADDVFTEEDLEGVEGVYLTPASELNTEEVTRTDNSTIYYLKDATTGARVTIATGYAWTVSDGEDGNYITEDGARTIAYRSDSGVFGAYARSNISGAVYYAAELIPVKDMENTYVIAANVDGTYYAMPSATFSGKPEAATITVTDGYVAQADASGFAVTVSKSSGTVTISNGSDCLGYKSGTDFAGVSYDVFICYENSTNTDGTLCRRAVYYYTNDKGVDVELTKEQRKSLNILVYRGVYETIGPKYEVYLTNSNGIAFEVNSGTNIQVSAKLPVGETADLEAYVGGNWEKVATVTSRTEMYYNLANYVDADGVVILRCNNASEDTVLSLCNIKGMGELAFGSGTKSMTKAIRVMADTSKDSVLSTDDELVFQSVNFSMGEELAVYYNISNAVATKYANTYVEVVKENKNGEATTVIYELSDMTDLSGFAYQFCYNGIYSYEMGDEFVATIWGVDEMGSRYKGESRSFSIADKIMEILENPNTTARQNMLKLGVDLLNYGAAAQVFFGYDTENLVNAGLTEEQKAYGTQSVPEAAVIETLTGDGFVLNPAVSLTSKVTLYVSVNLEGYEGDVSALNYVVKNAQGNDLAQGALEVLEETSFYRFSYDQVGAANMREPLTIGIYEGDTLISQELTWSVESYCAEKMAESDANMAALAQTMLIYGDSCGEFLAGTE